MQVDHMNRGVPQDWFLGYDQLAVYTFLNLGGQLSQQAGYLKTFIRPKIQGISLINNLDVFKVDYSRDFIGELGKIGGIGYPMLLWYKFYAYFIKIWAMGRAFYDLIVMYIAIMFVSGSMKQIIWDIFYTGVSVELNLTKVMRTGLIVYCLY